MDSVNSIMTQSMLILLGYIIEVGFNILVIMFLSRYIINSIKRRANRNYFKNNVVINPKVGTSIDNKDNCHRTYEDVSKEVLEKFNTEDINLLKDYFYDMFLSFENAYNNLDYNIMKILSTKQLYQNYYTGISLDLKAGKKKDH